MTDEERQRQMDFILDQQAQFAADMQQANQRLGRLERVVKLAVRAGVRTRRDVRTPLAVLVDAQVQTQAALQQMAAAQTHTDQRLDALIDVVREGRAPGR